MVVVKNINKKYGKVSVLNDISFSVPKGEIFLFMGPSPSGKSVLMKTIMGLEKPTSGTIYIDGQDMTDIPPYERDIALIFQDYMLFPHMKVRDNIGFGLRMRHVSPDKIKSEVKDTMNLTGLEELGDRYPGALSGGQRQRVALARSLVVHPKVLLLDEPLGNLDFKLQGRMILELRHLHEKLGITFIYVTHSIEQAMSLADNIAVLNKGSIEQIGTPHEIYTNPSSVFVASFVGDLNLLWGEVTSTSGDTSTLKSPVGTFSGTFKGKGSLKGKVAYAVRPEKVFLEDEAKDLPNKVEATLITQIYVGSDMQYETQLPDGSSFKAIKKGHGIVDLSKKIGENVLLGWESSNALLLNK